MKKVLFTDLDGTLLDLRSYSYSKSESSLKSLKDQGVPVVFCSSKSRAEQEYYRQILEVNDPFIVENGSAIFIPKGYFKKEVPFNTYVTDDYEVIQLGESVTNIRQTIKELREDLLLDFVCYFDIPPEEVSLYTSLNLNEAKRAMKREFSETILRGAINEKFLRRLKRRGLMSIPGSKFNTVISKQADKGKAIEILQSLYKNESQDLFTFGVGDSGNDLEMFKVVDDPYIVQRPSGEWYDLKDDTVKKASGVGPEGWNKVVEIILNA